MIYLAKQGAEYVAASHGNGGLVAPNSGATVAGDELDRMSADELAGYGFVRVEEPAPQSVPFGKRLAAIAYAIAEDGTVTASQSLEDVPLEDLKAGLKASVSSKRWEVETSGCEIAPGIRVRTDETSQAKLNGAVALMEKAAARGLDIPAIPWEAQAGEFVDLTLDNLVSAGLSVGLRVQSTFAVKRGLFVAIDAAQSVDELAAIDLETGWPA